ncbi:hypothetical protein IJM86_00775 [bacterium]|nr:hypothetical protein [bacterium]
MFEEFQDKLEEFDGDLEKLKDMNIKIPKRIRQESALFDQFLDFYIELIGEQHIKNTDTGSFRLFSAPFFHTFAVHCIDGMLTTSTPELRKEFFSDLVDDYAFLRKFFEEMEAQMKKQKSPSNGVQLAELNLFSFYQLLFKWQAVVFQDFLEQDREKNSDSRFWKWLKKRYGEIISKETS